MSKEIDLHVERLDCAPEQLYGNRALLSADELNRADRFRFHTDRRRFAVARAGLRRLLGQVLGVSPASLVFESGPYGKPALGGRWRGELEFNVAHSQELVVYALSAGGPVGVDLEWLHDTPDHAVMARSHFADSERATLESLAPADRMPAFFRCWTRKEAVLKALGEGLSHALDTFEVTFAADAPPQVIAIEGDAARAACWSLFSLEPKPGYIAAVAAPRAPVVLHLHG